MTWLDLAAATAVAVALVFVPGLALTFAAGLRGLWVAALAAPAGVTVIGVAAVASPMMGQGWSVSSVAIVTVVAAVVLFALRALVWRRQPADSTLRGRGVFVFAAVAIAVAVTTVQLVLMIGAPDSISQTFDNVFHLNAVRYILDHGNASPLFVASMTSAGAPASFYPTGWHAIASLVVMISGVTIRWPHTRRCWSSRRWRGPWASCCSPALWECIRGPASSSRGWRLRLSLRSLSWRSTTASCSRT